MPEPVLSEAADIGPVGTAGRYVAVAGATLAPRCFDAPAVGVLAGGAYSDTLHPRDARIEGPAVVAYSPGRETAVDFVAPESRFYWFRASPQWSRWLERRAPRTRTLHRGGAWLNAMRFYRLAQDDPGFVQVHAEELLLDILAEVELMPSPRPVRRSRWLDQVLERLHDDEFVTLSALATDLQLHPSHLARAFRQRTGCTVGQYRARLRLDAVAAALHDRHESVATLAQDFGFADQSHLCRQFRRYFGVAPGEFRRRHGR